LKMKHALGFMCHIDSLFRDLFVYFSIPAVF
jgi:hypothetical protein